MLLARRADHNRLHCGQFPAFGQAVLLAGKTAVERFFLKKCRCCKGFAAVPRKKLRKYQKLHCQNQRFRSQTAIDNFL